MSQWGEGTGGRWTATLRTLIHDPLTSGLATQAVVYQGSRASLGIFLQTLFRCLWTEPGLVA